MKELKFLIDIDEFEKNIPEIFKPIINNIKELKNILLNNEMGVILKPNKRNDPYI